MDDENTIHLAAFAEQVYDLFINAQIDETPEGEIVIYTGMIHDPEAPEYLTVKEATEQFA